MDPSTTEPRGIQAANPFFVVGAVILLIINIFIVTIGATPTEGGSAYLIGFLVGAAVVTVGIGLLVYGVARAFRKARTRAGAAKVGFWTMAVLFLANLGNFAAQARSATPASSDTAVTDAERGGLELDANSIRHPEFGFVLPHPGPGFSSSPEFQRQLDEGLSQQPDMVGWAFRDTAQRQALVVQVAKVASLDEDGFRNFTTGIRLGFTKVEVLEDTVSWQDAAGDYRLTLLHPAGLYITMRCLPRVRPGESLIVCVQSTADQPTALEPSRAGLRFIE